MHTRRLAAFLLGAWLSGSFFMIMVATHNMTAADRMASAPPGPAATSVEILGETAARTFLRTHSSELNRWYFDTWEWVEIGLGAFLLGALIRGPGRHRSAVLLCAFMLLAALLTHFAITPQATRLGRLVDAIPAEQPSPYRIRLGNYNTAYAAIECAKWLLGLMLLSSLLRRHASELPAGEERRKWRRVH
jgi:hypothetical protein